MRNIVCPVSKDRISEYIPRINAGLIILLLLLYVTTQLWIIPAFLIIDFYTRGFNKGKYSLLGVLSTRLSEFIPSEAKQINKAPKVFAAKLGFVLTSIIVALHFIGLPPTTSFISFMLILFAGLECVVNFCVGCWVYTLFVQPFYRN